MGSFNRKDNGKGQQQASYSDIAPPRRSWLRRLTGTSSSSLGSARSVPDALPSTRPRANSTAFDRNEPNVKLHPAPRPEHPLRAQTAANYTNDPRIQWVPEATGRPGAPVFQAGNAGMGPRPTAVPMVTSASNIGNKAANHPRGYDPAKKPLRERIDSLIMAEHAFDTMKLPYALKLFSSADETPHSHFNLGQIHIFMCAPTFAREHFERAVMMDSWFCAAWMMLGAIRFNEGEYVDAKQAWNTSLKCFRGRKTIDYEQLGLAYTVHYEEVLWNRAAAERALELGGSAGMRPACVPMGAIFRVPGRIAKVRAMVVGQGTEWGFKGEGRVVGKCESIYLARMG